MLSRIIQTEVLLSAKAGEHNSNKVWIILDIMESLVQ